MGNSQSAQFFDYTNQNVWYNTKTNCLHLPDGKITKEIVSKSTKDNWTYTFITEDGNSYKVISPTYFH